MSLSFFGDFDTIKSAVLGMAAGIMMFINGFIELKKKRTVQDIPTSKINTGAIGTNIEICGKIVAEDGHLVTAPISGRKCVLYHIQIDKAGDQNNSWDTIDEYFSDDGFFLDDQSGASALALLEGAEFHHTEESETLFPGSYEPPLIPEPLKQSLLSHQHKIKNYNFEDTRWYDLSYYRISEWCFMADEEIYLLGFAESGLGMGNTQSSHVKNARQAKKEIKYDQTLRNHFDSNKNGKLDETELEQGSKILAERLASKYSKKKVEELIPQTKMVFKYRKPFPFIISKHSERNLTKRMNKGILAKIWGGPVLTLGSLAYLLIVFFE